MTPIINKCHIISYSNGLYTINLFFSNNGSYSINLDVSPSKFQVVLTPNHFDKPKIIFWEFQMGVNQRFFCVMKIRHFAFKKSLKEHGHEKFWNFPKKSSHFKEESYKMGKIFGLFQWIPLLVSILKDPQIHVLKNARLHFYMKYHSLAQVFIF